jgi:hypothetical protein
MPVNWNKRAKQATERWKEYAKDKYIEKFGLEIPAVITETTIDIADKKNEGVYNGVALKFMLGDEEVIAFYEFSGWARPPEAITQKTREALAGPIVGIYSSDQEPDLDQGQ